MSEKTRLLKLSGLFEGVEAVNPTARRICSISKDPSDFVALCRDHGLSRDDVFYAVQHLYAATKQKTQRFMDQKWPIDGPASEPFDDMHSSAMSEAAEFALKRPHLDPDEFLDIDCPVGSGDYKMFVGVINQGIDSHLEGFTKSKFLPYLNDGQRRMLFGFHKSELPILLRRLDELENEDADSWASDIRQSEGLEDEWGSPINKARDGETLGEPDPPIHEWVEPLEEHGQYDLVGQYKMGGNAQYFDSYGLNEFDIEKLQTIINLMTSDEGWLQNTYGGWEGRSISNVIHDVFDVVKKPKSFLDSLEGQNPMAAANMLKQKIKAKKVPMAMAEGKKVKLSQLSEGLRSEVEKLVKEGKTKLSEFPEDVRKRVLAETKG